MFFIFFVYFMAFFGYVGDNCNITHFLTAIFVVFMIGLIIQTYVFVKIPFTREYLENLVGKDFLEKYLGKYTGCKTLTKIIKYVGPAVGLIIAEAMTANQQNERFLYAAKHAEENFKRDYKTTNRIPTQDDYNAMFKVRDEYLHKAAHANGIISRGIASSFTSFFSSDSLK